MSTARIRGHLAGVQLLMGRIDDALDSAEEAVEDLEEETPDPILMVHLKTLVGRALERSGSVEESLAVRDEALAAYEAERGSKPHEDVLWLRTDKVGALLRLKRQGDAVVELRTAVEESEALYGAGHAYSVEILEMLIACLVEVGRENEAAEYRERLPRR